MDAFSDSGLGLRHGHLSVERYITLDAQLLSYQVEYSADGLATVVYQHDFTVAIRLDANILVLHSVVHRAFFNNLGRFLVIFYFQMSNLFSLLPFKLVLDMLVIVVFHLV